MRITGRLYRWMADPRAVRVATLALTLSVIWGTKMGWFNAGIVWGD